MTATMRLFQRFYNVPKQTLEKRVEFCWSELFLFKSLGNIERDIGLDDITMISNWESLNYNSWHLEWRSISNNIENHNDS